MTTNRNKQQGKNHEYRAAKRRPDRRVVPLSGSGSIKGDVLGTYEIIQCKSSRRRGADGAKSISIRVADLVQLRSEQAIEQKPLAILHIHYTGERNDWVIMSEAQYEEMLEAWIAQRGSKA